MNSNKLCKTTKNNKLEIRALQGDGTRSAR